MAEVSICARVPQTDLEELTARVEPELQSLRGARLLITGGTGYIGRWLLESLCHANRVLGLGAQALVLSRSPERFAAQLPHLATDPALFLFRGDVRDFLLPEGAVSHVIHGATDVVAVNRPLEVFDVTVSGTRRVLEWARQRGARDVLLMSSGAVYGRIPAGVERIPEDCAGALDLGAPASAYGLGKAASEWLLNAYAQEHGLACRSARIFAQVGPHLTLDGQFAAGNFIRDTLRGRSVVIKGDGTSLRSYMYATDLVAWLWTILVRGRSGQAYNVGSEQAISIQQLAQAVVQVAAAQDVAIEVLGQAAPGAAPERYVPDTRRAREELGLSLTVPLADALGRTIDWYRPQITGGRT